MFYKCCDCILILTKLNDEYVMDSIIKTNLCLTLSTHLRNLFSQLPNTLEYNGLDTIELNWRQAIMCTNIY